MYVILDNENVIIAISESVIYEDNENVVINNGSLAIPKILYKKIVEVSELPSTVSPQRYCYTEQKGFYINKNFLEQKDLLFELNEKVKEQEQAIMELTILIAGGIA